MAEVEFSEGVSGAVHADAKRGSALSRVPAPTVPPGYVALYCAQPPLSLTCLMGDAAPTLTSGFGGWEVVKRPRRIALTSWEGGDPLRLTISLMLDGYRASRSVEVECRTLERFGRPSSFSSGQPPILHVGGPVPHTELEWVVESLDFGDSLRLASGERVRQQATIVLMQYVEDEHLVEIAAAVEARQRAEAGNEADVDARSLKSKDAATKASRAVTARTGDDLQRIAQRELGRASRWREIAKLNNIRDPKKVKPGQVVKVPR